MQDYVSNPVFTQGEVQQLRKLLSEQIQRLERRAYFDKEDAKMWKDHSQHVSNQSWKDHFKAREKIKKLAALQVKLKMVQELY